ncbi:AraC family transcriptional regulator [Paenibacillus tengchongensis]|uniref:AraC family transcriptional regulator n=1 Tax=Paenibacillus tengchongensis TaxID=2608684 RepID=UPI00124DB691|nr:AraC family transcriptional regulator [Paenibacillus tengchongensis]
MKKIPLMLQLALILFIIMAVPTAFLTWYSGEQIVKNSEAAIGETTLAGLNANRKLNENAMANLAQDTSRLAATKIFDRIRSFKTYDELNSNYTNVSRALAVLNEMRNLIRQVDGVESFYFYLEDSDYVISTDEGITTLERYEPIDWTAEALRQQKGISGVWVPRKLNSGVNVVSYVYPLNRLSSTTNGLIVVNVKESQIGKYLHATEIGDSNYLLLAPDGNIISNKDKSLLLTDGLELPFLREVLAQGANEGYMLRELEGKRAIYAWSRSALSGWWYVTQSSMDELMIASRDMQRNIVLLTGAIILLGMVIAVFLAIWLSRPVRQLVRTIRSKSDLGVVNRNELAFLDMAFKRLQEEEESLSRLLKEREQDTHSLAIHRLLRGEVPELINGIFPESCYRIAVVSIDQYRRYVGKTNFETRSYHRYLLVAKYDSLFPEGITVRSVYHYEGCIAVVLNYASGRQEQLDSPIHQALEVIREQTRELIGHTVTIGVSGGTDTPEMVSQRLFEAMEMIKRRMIVGGGSIMYWQNEAENSRKYIDFECSERRILNFLDTGNLEGIYKELENIRSQIRAEESISYDNIMFIYNQLMGVTIKHLRENHIGTGRMIMGRGNVYTIMAEMDTLDELEEYLLEFFGEIVQSLDSGSAPGETNYGERIIHYLKEHYREEIVFEDMAKEIGISYSYMRKIVYEMTGKSMIDYLNQVRIEKAKQLLVDSGLTIKQIAAEVGYYNVQSFNRFFRKYEGMPPSSYKSVKNKTS